MLNRANRYLFDKKFNEYNLDRSGINTLSDIYACAIEISNHMGLRRGVSIAYSELLGNIPARIVNDVRNQYCLLEINQQMKFSDAQMKALLVHELTHAFILENKMEYEGFKNEFFTDFMAVYLGFGKIMSSGSLSREVLSSSGPVNLVREQQLGYLTQQQLIQARKLIFNRPKFWEINDYLVIHPFLSIIGAILTILASYYFLYLVSLL